MKVVIFILGLLVSSCGSLETPTGLHLIGRGIRQPPAVTTPENSTCTSGIHPRAVQLTVLQIRLTLDTAAGSPAPTQLNLLATPLAATWVPGENLLLYETVYADTALPSDLSGLYLKQVRITLERAVQVQLPLGATAPARLVGAGTQLNSDCTVAVELACDPSDTPTQCSVSTSEQLEIKKGDFNRYYLQIQWGRSLSPAGNSTPLTLKLLPQ